MLDPDAPTVGDRGVTMKDLPDKLGLLGHLSLEAYHHAKAFIHLSLHTVN